MLSFKEKQLIDKIGLLMNDFKNIRDSFKDEFPVYEFVKCDGDWNELCLYIHQLQNWVLSNSASRTYPDKFRPFGLKHNKWIINDPS